MANDNGDSSDDGGSSGNGTPAAGSFARDILPKFRPLDISCMARRHVKLADATWMCDPAANPSFPDFADHANARRVFAMLSAKAMPPDGPWSQDWLDTYQNWMDTGFLP
jgi:hypothetical protein